MTTYIPRFEPQHDEGLRPPFTNCNPASAAMLVDLWTWGAIDTSDVFIRQASGISVAVGMNFAAVNVGIKKLAPALGELRYSEHEGTSTAPMSWNQLLAHLGSGGGAIVCGDYINLPVEYRRWSPNFTGGHAAFACDYREADETFLWGDPMSIALVRAPIGLLWDFIWSTGKADGNVRVTAAHGFSNPRPARPAPSPVVVPIILRSPIVTQRWTAKPGATYTKADGTDAPLGGEVQSVLEVRVGGVDCRVIELEGGAVGVARRSMMDPIAGTRVVGSAANALAELRERMAKARVLLS